MDAMNEIRAAVKAAKQRGYGVVCGMWNVARGWGGQWDVSCGSAACGLALYLIATQPISEEMYPDRAAAKALEVSSWWVEGFTHGWDGFVSASYDDDYSRGYYAGKALAEEEGLR